MEAKRSMSDEEFFKMMKQKLMKDEVHGSEFI
jgi:hypothetical protein